MFRRLPLRSIPLSLDFAHFASGLFVLFEIIFGAPRANSRLREDKTFPSDWHLVCPHSYLFFRWCYINDLLIFRLTHTWLLSFVFCLLSFVFCFLDLSYHVPTFLLIMCSRLYFDLIHDETRRFYLFCPSIFDDSFSFNNPFAFRYWALVLFNRIHYLSNSFISFGLWMFLLCLLFKLFMLRFFPVLRSVFLDRRQITCSHTQPTPGVVGFHLPVATAVPFQIVRGFR